MAGALGRLVPPDTEHLDKYPLSALPPEELPVGIPVPLGVNWYDSFDEPKEITAKDGSKSYHLPDVGKGEPLGSIRGGHCFSTVPMGQVVHDTNARWTFYNQGQEGACVGFGLSRMNTIDNGKLYDAFWLYDMARKSEGTYPDGEGSTVRAGCKVLTKGHRVQTGETVCTRDTGDGAVALAEGISAYRWALTAEEVCKALNRLNAQAIPFENSWGKEYPKETWMPVATLERLLKEEGEAAVVVDR
jgi:hypothetical protein